MKEDYKFLSDYYKKLMGESYSFEYVKLIKKYCKKNISELNILDMACGTGDFLKKVSKNNRTFGIDNSKQMLQIAKKADPQSKYMKMKMENLNLPVKFDIITCQFDSINHILNFNDWKKVFTKTSLHLKNEGYFLFDFNTLEKFKRIHDKQLIKKIGSDYVIISTEKNKNFCTWKINFFKKIHNNTFALQKESIVEASFPIKKITTFLKKKFLIKKMITQKDRLFVICKKKLD